MPLVTALALAAFVITAAIFAWRLYVGLSASARGPVGGAFVTSLVGAFVTLPILGWTFVTGVAGAAGAYAAMLVATAGRPERMLETWRVCDDPEPPPEVQQAIRRNQWRFIGLVVIGVTAVVIATGG